MLTVSGERTTATAPRSTTIVSMFDYKFTLNRSLPRNGTIRVVNKGKRVHMMIALKAANRKGANALSKALRKGDRNAEKLIRGGGPSLDPVSPGANVQLPSVRLRQGLVRPRLLLAVQAVQEQGPQQPRDDQGRHRQVGPRSH